MALRQIGPLAWRQMCVAFGASPYRWSARRTLCTLHCAYKDSSNLLQVRFCPRRSSILISYPCWESLAFLPTYSIDWHASYISFTTEHIHRLDPIKFPTLHSLDKAPSVSKIKRNAVIQPSACVSMVPLVYQDCQYVPVSCPRLYQSMAALFARKIPKADGTASKDYYINENLI